MKLSFSQASQPTPSAQLSGFRNMSLSSQSRPGPTQDKPPVPLFAEAAGGGAAAGGVKQQHQQQQ